MTITEIYEKYTILPFLQLHMLRVASVGKQVAVNMSVPVNLNEIVITCLLHDMGNIIKFNLDLFPGQLDPKGTEYWNKVQQEYIDKYGRDEHYASNAIATELGVSPRVHELLQKVGFSQSEENFNSADFDVKICGYADNRVSPFGIVSLKERLEGGKVRYEKNHQTSADMDFYNKMFGFSQQMEGQIFANCKIKPEEITDESTKQLQKELSEFELN